MSGLAAFDLIWIPLSLAALGMALREALRPSPGGRRLAQALAGMSSALLFCIPLLGLETAWGRPSLGGGLLGLLGLLLARRGLERWPLAGAMALALGLRLLDLGRAASGAVAPRDLPEAFGLACLTAAGLALLEERRCGGTARTQVLRLLRWAFAALVLALLLATFGEGGAEPGTGLLLLVGGGLLHLHRARPASPWTFRIAGLLAALLAGLRICA